MNEDLIVTQIGLLFSQIRYIRMAVEQMERNTARYAGVTLEAAFASSGGFGAPPMMDGALKVWVVNIGDLIDVSNTVGGIFGAVGRFVGSLFGGFVGGIVGGAALPVNLWKLAQITDNLNLIIDKLGLGPGGSSDKPSGSTWIADLKGLLDRLARVFTGAGEAPKGETEESRNWLVMITVASRIVDGLILLIPILVGAFASLLLKIDQLKISLLDLLEFALRNVLLLRGVILVTLFDTMSVAASLAARLLAILSTAVSAILGSLFRMIEAVLDTAMKAFAFLSKAIAELVNALLPWLVTTVFEILNKLGELTVFKTIHNTIVLLAAAAPILMKLAGVTPDPGELKRLGDAASSVLITPVTVKPPTLTDMPDVSKLPGVQEAMGEVPTAIMGLGATLIDETKKSLGTAGGALTDIGAEMSRALGPGEDAFQKGLKEKLGGVTAGAEEYTKALTAGRKAAEEAPKGPLADLAGIYEKWLAGGGLDQVLKQITDHFKSSPGAPLAEGIAGAAATEPARATVEIPEVIIEIVPPAKAHAGAAGPAKHALRVERESDVDPEEASARGLGLFAYEFATG